MLPSHWRDFWHPGHRYQLMRSTVCQMGLCLESAHTDFWLNRNLMISAIGYEMLKSITNTCQTYARVQKHNDYDMYIVYWTGEFVIVSDAESEGTEWLVHLTDIIVYGPIMNKFYYFLNGTYFAAISTHHGTVEYDTWTGPTKDGKMRLPTPLFNPPPLPWSQSNAVPTQKDRLPG